MFLQVFSGAPPLFQLFFLVVLILVVAGFVRSAAHMAKNATSPVLEARATVLTKRTQVFGNTHTHVHDGHPHHQIHTSTAYYATFELENGERLELVMNGRQFGLLVDGDVGQLTYQGDWYKGFVREQ